MNSEKNDEHQYGSIEIVCSDDDADMGVDVELLIQPEKAPEKAQEKAQEKAPEKAQEKEPKNCEKIAENVSPTVSTPTVPTVNTGEVPVDPRKNKKRQRAIDDDELLHCVENGDVGNEILKNQETTIFTTLLEKLKSNFCKRYLSSWAEYVNTWAVRLENSEILTKSNYTSFGKLANFVMMSDRTLKNRVEAILSSMMTFGHKLDGDLSKIDIRQLSTLETADPQLLYYLTKTATIVRAISNGLFALESAGDQVRIIDLDCKLIDFLKLLDSPQILELMNVIHQWDIPSLLFFTKRIKQNLVKSVMGSSTGRKIVATSDSRIFSCLPKEILLAYKHAVRCGRLYESTQASAEMPEVPVQPSGSRYIPKRTSKNKK